MKTVPLAEGPEVSPQPEKRKAFYRHTYFQVLLAIAVGSLIGHFAPQTGQALRPFGDGSFASSR